MTETIIDKISSITSNGGNIHLYMYKNGWFTIARLVPLDDKGNALSPQSLYARIKIEGIGHPNLMKPKMYLKEKSRLGGKAATAALSCGEPDNKRTALKQRIKLESIPVGKYDNL